jgi:hypothetical protein
MVSPWIWTTIKYLTIRTNNIVFQMMSRGYDCNCHYKTGGTCREIPSWSNWLISQHFVAGMASPWGSWVFGRERMTIIIWYGWKWWINVWFYQYVLRTLVNRHWKRHRILEQTTAIINFEPLQFWVNWSSSLSDRPRFLTTWMHQNWDFEEQMWGSLFDAEFCAENKLMADDRYSAFHGISWHSGSATPSALRRSYPASILRKMQLQWILGAENVETSSPDADKCSIHNRISTIRESLIRPVKSHW